MKYEKLKYKIKKKRKLNTNKDRLIVRFTNKHIYCQLIKNDNSSVIFTATTFKSDLKTKKEKLIELSEITAQMLKEKDVLKVAFDRFPYIYHGNVKYFVELLREKGIEL
jgi:large subunit ribosomal protein L18